MIKKEKKYIEKIEEEISKMKQDSIALISQITTISKQRILFAAQFKIVENDPNAQQ